MESQEHGNNLENTYINNEALVSCISKYPVLYDKSRKDYRVPLNKKNAWEEIMLERAIDWRQAQTHYNTVRKIFTKYLKWQNLGDQALVWLMFLK